MKQHYLEIIWYKALAELRAEAARSFLGFLWWIFEPVIYMAAFYVVFGLIFERGGAGFVPFLLCGLVAWKWFASTVTSAANSIPANSGLMQQVYLPKHVFPAIVLVVNTVKFLVVLGLLLVFLVLYGHAPSYAWLGLPALLFVQCLFIAAVAGLVASIVPFVPDFKLLLDNAMMVLFFVSGVFFDIGSVPEHLQFILKLNPMAGIIDGYRAILMQGLWPSGPYLGFVLAISAVGIWLAGRTLTQYDRIYPKVLV
jgi:lipopolysaccharide transport system permease protein